MTKVEPINIPLEFKPIWDQITIPINLELDAVMPTKAHPTDAGFDLYAVEDIRILTGEIQKIKTGIKMNIPPGYVGLIQDKSSIGSKGLKVFGGVIDAGYIGEILVCLGNCSKYGQTMYITKGQKVAQLVILPLPIVEFIQAPLEQTDRGEKGFGSSGS